MTIYLDDNHNFAAELLRDNCTYKGQKQLIQAYNICHFSYYREQLGELICKLNNKLKIINLSQSMRFTTVGHFDKCRLRQASAASF